MNIIPTEFPAKKPHDELRIIVIGASISWEGPRPSKSEGNYPSRTLELLERDHPGRSLRLINLSVPGFGTTRQLVRFREALDYDADLFIIHTHDTNEVREDQRIDLRAQATLGDRGQAPVCELGGRAEKVVGQQPWKSPGPRPVVDAAEEEAEGLGKENRAERWMLGMQSNVRTMLELAKARSIPVILVGAGRGDNGGRDRPLNDYLRTCVRGSSVQFLDVPGLFRAEIEQKHRRFYKDKVHYNAEGSAPRGSRARAPDRDGPAATALSSLRLGREQRAA